MPGYIPVEYTADSFFYIKSPKILTVDCKPIISTTCIVPLSDTNIAIGCSNSDSDTYNGKLCKNMNLAQQLVSIQNNKGEIQSYTDTNDQYLMEYYRTFNLSFGIIGILAFYYYA